MISYDKLSDTELCALLKQDDHQAYREIYERYWLPLLAHARRALQNIDEGSDIIQDVFTKLWDNRQEIQITTSLSAFLYAVVRNKVLDRFKKIKVVNHHLDSLREFMANGESVTDHRVRERELAAIIEKEIAALPTRMREVFELKRKANKSYKEIAAEMNISELTVKTQMNKAIKLLKAKLGTNLFNSFFPFL